MRKGWVIVFCCVREQKMAEVGAWGFISFFVGQVWGRMGDARLLSLILQGRGSRCYESVGLR